LFSLPVSAFGAGKVTLRLKWFHQFQFAGYYAAGEKGFYAAEGLDVLFRQRDTKTGYIDDVLEGKAQYGTSDAGLLFSRLQGKPVVVLAQIFQHSPLVLLTLKESGLRSPYQLAGKKVMIDTVGFSDAPANGMLFKTLGGLDQLQPVQMTFRYEDLIEKKVDAVVAYVTDQPFKFQEAGVDVNILDPRDYGIDFYGDNLFTTEQEIIEHPQRVEKMIRATIKG
jgi:ABC-type nitrate/sulfonate/bicarbonate transport system substrate-binding protein